MDPDLFEDIKKYNSFEDLLKDIPLEETELPYQMIIESRYPGPNSTGAVNVNVEISTFKHRRYLQYCRFPLSCGRNDENHDTFKGDQPIQNLISQIKELFDASEYHTSGRKHFLSIKKKR
ncbi:MAG: hypothetical protein PHT54_03930 [Candidatus Nanoarchaeia archaeon]|nr:hypothetical protein [Candidatus Nanoarchaeia archaeon]